MSCDCLIAATTMLTPCECPPGAGPCSRHGCYKADRMKELCRTKPNYFQAWENKTLPCVGDAAGIDPVAANADVAAIGSRGFGDTLAWIAGLVGITGWVGCGCDARRQWLNLWVPYWWKLEKQK